MVSPARNSLLQPLRVGHKTLKNRIVFGAHTANMSALGLPGEQHRAYYEERALGGAAMIVVEPMPVHPTAVLTRGNFRPQDDRVIKPFQVITEACKRHGAVMIQQLYHVGQHGDADNAFTAAWSPSGRPSYHDSDGSHAMSEAEIEEIIAAFVAAAKRCQAAGFDGIELFANYHALIEQFWTLWSNWRTDQWGGSLENRMRFSSRLMEDIRAACGADFIIGLAISQSPHTQQDMSTDELLQIVGIHDAHRHMDYITCGTGGYLDFGRLMPTFVYADKLGADLASKVKATVKHALVICESHVRTPENGDYIIASGEADMVSIVRGQIADPHLATKTLEQREEDIRGCISCNQMCWGRRSRDYWISCLINPSVGREYKWGGDRFTASKHSKQVLVIGAGPAGLECARVAASRGHQVTLCEALPELGGQFYLAGLAPRRGQILELLGWYQTQLQKLGVKVNYNTYMDADDIAAFGADEVIVATGSLFDGRGSQRWLGHTDTLPGLDSKVYAAEQVMRKELRLNAGDPVIVLDEGGNWRGVGTALHLAQQGHPVTIVTPDPYVGHELTRTSADGPLRAQLKQAGTHFMVESLISHWHGDGATITSMLDGSTERVNAAALVLATTNMAFNDLELELTANNISCHTIGDCVAPRQAPYAFYEGRKLGLSL
ncbi:MAG: FAD-dependent oxidoreductase [Gammaproteobacteria bacterium]|jgi:2,4-dienoyl-CoA reductase-like NADH-dependent reductase (Old Yellow Enzyme family)/thioredoxin reductase|nr:FAD-dependent oxidoreductase [Gammaproteobacteria bacterium]